MFTNVVNICVYTVMWTFPMDRYLTNEMAGLNSHYIVKFLRNSLFSTVVAPFNWLPSLPVLGVDSLFSSFTPVGVKQQLTLTLMLSISSCVCWFLRNVFPNYLKKQVVFYLPPTLHVIFILFYIKSVVICKKFQFVRSSIHTRKQNSWSILETSPTPWLMWG